MYLFSHLCIHSKKMYFLKNIIKMWCTAFICFLLLFHCRRVRARFSSSFPSYLLHVKHGQIDVFHKLVCICCCGKLNKQWLSRQQGIRAYWSIVYLRFSIPVVLLLYFFNQIRIYMCSFQQINSVLVSNSHHNVVAYLDKPTLFITNGCDFCNCLKVKPFKKKVVNKLSRH